MWIIPAGLPFSLVSIWLADSHCLFVVVKPFSVLFSGWCSGPDGFDPACAGRHLLHVARGDRGQCSSGHGAEAAWAGQGGQRGKGGQGGHGGRDVSAGRSSPGPGREGAAVKIDIVWPVRFSWPVFRRCREEGAVSRGAGRTCRW